MGIKIIDISPRDITTPSVCIVRFAGPIGPSDIKAGLFFQVVIDPANIKGEFIRFGDAKHGDELVGWQPLDFIRVCHVIAEKSGPDSWDTLEEPPALGITIEQSRSN